MIEIRNLPMNHDRYVVALYGGSFAGWYYWGSFKTEEEAYDAALEVDGFVFIRDRRHGS